MDLDNIGAVQLSVMGEPLITLEKRGKFKKLVNLLNEVELERVTQEKAVTISKLSRFSEYKAIDIVSVKPEDEMNGHYIIILKDGRLVANEIKNGIGGDWYMIAENSPQLYNDVLSFYEENNVLEETPQVLDVFENKDGDHTIEVPLIKQPIDER